MPYTDLPFELPEGWAITTLNDIGVYKKGPFGSSLTKSMFVPKSENTVKVYEQKNAIQKDSTLGSYYISREYFETKMRGFEVESGDIIVSCAGTIGETYVMPKNIEQGIINQALMKMKITSQIDMEYFLLYFDYVLKQSAQSSSKGSAIKNIPPFEIFKQLILPLPPLAEQHRIVAKIEELLPHITEYEKKEQSLHTLLTAFPDKLKKSILQEAVMGKLVPQDPSDEPASVLLERIRKEKERLIKEGKIKADKKCNTSDKITYTELPFEVPENWEWVQLNDISDIYTGNSINETEKKLKYSGLSDGYFYIGTKDVDFENNVNYDNGVKIPFDNGKFRIAKEKSVLMCVEGGSAGRKIALIDKDVCFGNKLCCFTPFLFDSDYLYAYLQSPCFVNFFKESLSGIIGGVAISTLKQIAIPLPPLAEQKRIVAKIQELSDVAGKLTNR